MQALLEQILPIIGSGGLGAAITYLVTFKSKKKLAEAEAEQSAIEAEQKRQDLKQD